MNGKKLLIQIWPERIKQSKRNNNTKALAFLESWEIQDPMNVLRELIAGTNAYQVGKWGSAYVVQIPNGDKEAIRNRWANHPSKDTEWPLKEINGLPNRRYSIFIYDEKTCPELASVAETKWKAYYSEGIPVYEKGFNVAFLNKTFNKMKNILIQIYKGGSPQPNRLSIKINESKTNKNMKKNTVKLTEFQLKKVISESVRKVLKEFQDVDYTDEDYVENIAAYDIIYSVRNDFTLDMVHQVLAGTLYDKNDKPVGCLNDLHYKYDARNGGNQGFIGA